MMQIKPFNFSPLFPPFLFKNGNGDVDKGTTRKTPGTGKGARPPREEEYPDDEERDEPQKEEVDNEEKDKNKE